MDGVVTLRKLAPRSLLGSELSPKYAGCTVEQLMELHPSTIWYVYTHFDRITFLPEIISQLKEKFPEFTEIDKPGKDPSTFKVRIDNLKDINQYSKEHLLKIITARKLAGRPVGDDILKRYYQLKARAKRVREKTRHIESKEAMQAKNHGR